MIPIGNRAYVLLREGFFTGIPAGYRSPHPHGMRRCTLPYAGIIVPCHHRSVDIEDRLSYTRRAEKISWRYR